MKALVLAACVGMLSNGCGSVTVESALEAAEHIEQSAVNVIDAYKEIESDQELGAAKQQLVQALGFLRAAGQQLRAKQWKLAVHDVTQAYGLISSAYAGVKDDPELDKIENNLELAVEHAGQALQSLGVSL